MDPESVLEHREQGTIHHRCTLYTESRQGVFYSVDSTPPSMLWVGGMKSDNPEETHGEDGDLSSRDQGAVRFRCNAPPSPSCGIYASQIELFLINRLIMSFELSCGSTTKSLKS